ncbi:type II secretion system F family protein [Acuticoccus sp.]|uniref:type II secretion system F family protein n=1 Tax=Acuticoccus sp. TaxID=1904378 RepID=UPI003B515698
MTRFEYLAMDAAGNVSDGAIEAASVADAADALARAGLTSLRTRPVRSSGGVLARLAPEPRPQHVTALTADLAMLLSGGVVLDEALAILADLEERRWLQRLVRSLKSEIAAGSSLSEALARHPAQFPPVYVETVRVAEAAGRLAEALDGLAAERRRAEALRTRVIGALAYPSFLVVAALGVLAFVLGAVIPQFEAAIEGFRDELDPAALFVFDLSRAFRDHADALGLGLAALLAGALVASRLGRGRALGIVLLSRLPGTRAIVAHHETMTFCRTLAVLIGNGVDITAALRLVRGVLRLPASAQRLDGVLAEVRQGRRLSDALAREGLMPRHVVQMLRVGEEAGELASSANRIAAFTEAKLSAALARLTAVLGPVLMVAVSLLIAWVIISVMSALVGINDLLV